MEANEIRAALDSRVLTGRRAAARHRSCAPGDRGLGREAGGLSGDPELAPVAENLGALRGQLSAGDFDQAAVGRLLSDIGDQAQRLANSDIQIKVADKLSQLSVLLSSEGE